MEAATIEKMGRTTIVPTEEIEEEQEMSTEQDIQGVEEIQECTTQLKRSLVPEQPPARKKEKTMKTMQGDLIDSSKPICEVTKDALAELMKDQTTVLGEVRA